MRNKKGSELMSKEEKIFMVMCELERVFGRLYLSEKEISERISETELDFYIKHLFGEEK